ncbi:G2/M phase-specific E3 ubiquitin-protein ligase-like [Melanotaenia boesemani]|uniref:G2/M phase-specific E3 ubiquitin-protein ligase-like n=1 Tax=Melanotaenia boesemani TaxID=1250792 RepID=UPI001C05D16D|nr:G2/M phase-specific E3 ubiquitin-protein ligase-like [Melanotaenia boesemani]
MASNASPSSAVLGQHETRNVTVQQEMSRAFPGYFKSNFNRGKKRLLLSTKQLAKTTSKIVALNFYLLQKNTSHTPMPAEELELLQAGMGRQTVSLPDDGDHAEISRLLTETFPKMENLCGGWLLHKATGGSGRRKLTIIPPEAEGYSVKALKAVSAGGKASPASVLKVVFIGEAGIDTGALKKEFLTDMISGIERRFFEGPGNQGKNPRYSLSDLDNENFRTIGEIMSVSLAQGGPAPAFFKEWGYNFLCTGEVDFSSLSTDDVADHESSTLISRVENAADTQTLLLWADEIISCGYTSKITHDRKESIIRAIVLHSTTRLIPMLQQLRKGMELYGLLNLMSTNREACHGLFVPGKIIKPDADFMMMNCKPQFSEKGTSKERTERKIINFLQDYLQELDIRDGEGESAGEEVDSLKVHHVLQWMTGQSHIPILPDEKRHFKITCNFDHQCQQRLGDHIICYPVVSACTHTVTFPVQHLNTYDDFRKLMSEAVRYGGGFHRV